jgi:hypothetical protein
VPFLLASASIRLSPGVHPRAGMLVDAQLTGFPLNAAGEVICDIARTSTSLSVVVDELAETLGLDRAACETDVHRFVVELHRRRLISVHQSVVEETLTGLALLPTRLAAIRRDGWRSGSGDTWIYRRYPASVRGVLRGCLEAHQLSMWVLAALVALVTLATIAVGAPTPHLLAITVRALALALSWYALLHWTSLVVHELCHLLVARLCHADIGSIYVRRGAMGLTFRAPSAAAGRAIVVSGAIGAMLYLAGSLLFILAAPASLWTTAALDQLRLAGLVAVVTLMAAQLLWLSPITRDGRELWASIPRHATSSAP